MTKESIYETGSYRGTKETFARVGSSNGVGKLECLVCGERVPNNWGNPNRHTCGTGEGVEGAGCCDDPEIENYWIEHDSDTGLTCSQRKKRCENCGHVHPLGVTERMADSVDEKTGKEDA